jgi:hypothetical protein
LSDLAYVPPRELLAESEKVMDSVSPAVLFNDPAHQDTFERWCAGIFGLGYEKAAAPCEVAVNETSGRLDVDFFLRVGRNEFPFQTTQAQEPGRRSGEEHRVPGARPARSWAEGERLGRVKGPSWIRESVAKKAARYREAGRDLNLLIYANFHTEQLTHEELVAELAEFRGAFRSIWVMDSVRLCSVYSSSDLGETNGWVVARPIEEYYR